MPFDTTMAALVALRSGSPEQREKAVIEFYSSSEPQIRESLLAHSTFWDSTIGFSSAPFEELWVKAAELCRTESVQQQISHMNQAIECNSDFGQKVVLFKPLAGVIAQFLILSSAPEKLARMFSETFVVNDKHRADATARANGKPAKPIALSDLELLQGPDPQEKPSPLVLAVKNWDVPVNDEAGVSPEADESLRTYRLKWGYLRRALIEAALPKLHDDAAIAESLIDETLAIAVSKEPHKPIRHPAKYVWSRFLRYGIRKYNSSRNQVIPLDDANLEVHVPIGKRPSPETPPQDVGPEDRQWLHNQLSRFPPTDRQLLIAKLCDRLQPKPSAQKLFYYFKVFMNNKSAWQKYNRAWNKLEGLFKKLH